MDYDKIAEAYVKFSETRVPHLITLAAETRDGVRKGFNHYDEEMAKLRTQVKNTYEIKHIKSERIKRAIMVLRE